MGQSRRVFSDAFKPDAVERLYEPGATQGGVAKELGVRRNGPSKTTYKSPPCSTMLGQA